jgi:hypothetical protein
MHELVRDALRVAIKEAGALLEPLAGQFKEPHLIWTKQDTQQWRGSFQERPALTTVFIMADPELNKTGMKFADVLRRSHPEYDGLVGIDDSRVNVSQNPSLILNHAMLRLRDNHGTFQPGDQAIEALVLEFSEFIDQSTIQLRFTAPLLNYQMDDERVALPDDLAIRRLTEAEVSDLRGGPFWLLGSPRQSIGIQEFALEGSCDAPKVFGEGDATPIMGEVRRRVDRAILALRTFKEGQIGYDSIRLRPTGFCPFSLPEQFPGDLHVPFGRYALPEDEVERLQQHAALVFACSEPALVMACSRLADAHSRVRPQDRLLDAVIGLEALLLAAVGKDDRGELKLRFSLNYSTLFKTSETRRQAFRVAKDLYNLRSTIAHGGSAEAGSHRVGGQKMGLQDAALRACEALRHVLHHFLPQAGQAPFKKSDFWEQQYFDLS